MSILVNDNLHSHVLQRGVARVYWNTIAALDRQFGPELLICSQQPHRGFGARSYRMPRLQGFIGPRHYSFYELHNHLVSLVAALERPALIYSPYYGALLSRAPQVYTVYDMIFECFPQYFPASKGRVRRLLLEKRYCLARASHLLAISEATARDLRAIYPHLPSEKIVAIPLGVEEVFFSEPCPFVAPRPYLLFPGMRALYKNFLALVHAYARSGLAEQFDLRVFSPGAPRFSDEEQRVIAGYGLTSRVLLTANPGDEQVRDLYAGAAAVVYPTLYEGFGFPVLEAMACGTIVAASRTSSLPEVGGDVPIYFDPHSPDAIAAAIVQAAGLAEEARRAMIARGRERARLFTWERFRERTAAVFRRFAGGAGAL